jgi:hypothetical protein
LDHISLSEKLFHLISDENFSKMEAIVSRPNFFNIIGRTYTETWHSMFMGWLLDPRSSHGLQDFTLKRFLAAALHSALCGKDVNKSKLSRIAAEADLTQANVYPNQESRKELSCEVGKFDVFVQVDGEEQNTNMILFIEQKVKAAVSREQCDKYLDWVRRNYEDYTIIPVLLAPLYSMKLTVEETVGSSEWFCMDYQILHDFVLTPIVRHPKLNPQVKLLVEQYIDLLKIPQSDGRKLAVTDEEKELALELFERHKDTFMAIQAALADTTDFKFPMEKNSSDRLVLIANQTRIEGTTVPEFFTSGLKFLVERKIIKDEIVPYATSAKRYLISRKMEHPNGNAFVAPISYGGYYMECNKSRGSAIRDFAKLLIALGVDVGINE